MDENCIIYFRKFLGKNYTDLWIWVRVQILQTYESEFESESNKKLGSGSESS